MEEIAERAKVSKPIVHEHFSGKEGLYAVIVDREVEHVVAAISEAISSGSPRERIEQAALAFLTYVKDHPDGFAVLVHDVPITASRGSAYPTRSAVDRGPRTSRYGGSPVWASGTGRPARRQGRDSAGI